MYLVIAQTYKSGSGWGGSQTAVTLHLEEWRNQMNDDINHINQVLPDTISREKNAEIQQ